MKGANSRERGKYREILLAGLIVIPLAVYIKGLAPSVVAGDTGDYLTAGWIWGISHPPGYGLYTFLVGVFERLPIQPFWLSVSEYSTPAWRGNLLSALISAGNLAVMFSLVRRITSSISAAIIATGALAFSRIYWWHSEIAENDALTGFFIISLLLLTVKWSQIRRPIDFYLIPFTAGLAVSHHQSILLFVPGILIFLYLGKRLPSSRKVWLASLLLFMLGMLPILIPPLVNYKTPEGPVIFEKYHKSVIGEDIEAEFTSKTPLKYFCDYVCRSIYGEMRKYSNREPSAIRDRTTTADVFAFYCGILAGDYGIIFVVIGAIGILFGYRMRNVPLTVRSRIDNGTGERVEILPGYYRGWTVILISYLVYAGVIHFYPSGDILNSTMYSLETAGPGLMLPLQILWAMFTGIGFSMLLNVPRKFRPVAGWIKTALLIAGLICIGFNWMKNREVGDKSRHTLVHEYCLNVLDSCPKDAVLVVAGDEIYPFWYFNNVHPDPVTGKPGYRTDVKIRAWSGALGNIAELADMSAAMVGAINRMAKKYPDREVAATFFNSKFLESPELTRYAIIRRGILFSFIEKRDIAGYEPSAEQLREKTGIAGYVFGMPSYYRWDFWGGNVIADRSLMKERERWLWAPDEEIRWRIVEMLIFYGADAILKRRFDDAEGYFMQWALMEPSNPDAWESIKAAQAGKSGGKP